MAHPQKQILVLGNGKAAVDFLKVLARFQPAGPEDVVPKIACVLVDASNEEPGTTSLADYCEQQGLRYLTSTRFDAPDIGQSIRECQPDLAISVNNRQILRRSLLEIPREGVVNFHNSLLPRYGGLHACTWALASGETQHGVTLHYLDSGVDTGDIIAQARFPVDEKMTTLQLILRCLQEGVRLFEQQLPALLNHTVARTKQDPALRTFHFKRQVPREGRVDFNLSFAEVNNLVRSLNFYPLPNQLAYPQATYRGRPLYLDRVSCVSNEQVAEPGTVMPSPPGHLQVQLRDSIARLIQVRDESQQRVPVAKLIAEYQIVVGSRLE